jgi:hypothetical protein
LIKEGLVDYLHSKIDARQNIYYPLVTEKIPIISITNPIDNLSQENLPIYEKITTEISKDWIFSEINGLIRYRLDQDTNEEFEDYVKNPEKFQILDNNKILEENDEEEINNSPVLSIDEFIDKYLPIVDIPIDIQRKKN